MVLHPQCMWAERSDKVYFTIAVQDVQDARITIADDGLSLSFRGVGGTDKQEYELDLPLKNAVDAGDSKWAVTPRSIVFVLEKKEPGYWGALLPSGKKLTNLSVDWDKYVDEDEEQETSAPNFEGMDFSSFMGGAGAGGGAPGGGFGAGAMDSDDEEEEGLPDLENVGLGGDDDDVKPEEKEGDDDMERSEDVKENGGDAKGSAVAGKEGGEEVVKPTKE